MVVIPVPPVTETKPVQFSKTFEPILVTLEGIVTEVIFVIPLKAELLMSVTLYVTLFTVIWLGIAKSVLIGILAFPTLPMTEAVKAPPSKLYTIYPSV